MPKKLDIVELRELKHLAERSRRPFESDWQLNMAYVSGAQDTRWAGGSVNRMVEVNRDYGEPDLTHNICIKIARTEVAKILKAKPTPTALPVTDGQDDLYAADVVDAWFKDLQDIWHYDRRLRSAVSSWLVPTGNVFFKWYWARGDARMAVIPPFDMYVDPYARTFMDAQWVIHSQFMSKEQAETMFRGVKRAKQEHIVESGTDTLSRLEARVLTDFGDGTANLPGVVMNEYWEPPSPMNEKGRYVAFTHSGVVLETDFPYAHGKMPFTHAGGIERSASKWHQSVIDFVRPFQDELNRVERQIVENRSISNGICFLPAEVQLETPISGKPRQVIKWSGPPELNPQSWWVTPQTLPGWVGNEPGRLKASAQDIIAQHEVSNAGVPGRVESGQAIQLLQETDDSVVTATIHSLEEAISDGFLQAAFLWKQYGTPTRMVRTYDKDGMVAVKELQRDHIAMDLRVRVQTTTGLPQTVAGKWDRVLNLLQYQVIDPQRAIELLDLSTEDPELAPGAQDRRNAYSENKQMLRNQVVRAYPWDDHDVHLDELDKFRKTKEYQRAVDFDPSVEEKFAFHEDEHKRLRAEKDVEMAQREAAVQQVLAGPQGAEGTGGPPGVTKESGLPQEPEAPAPADNGSPAPVA